MKRRKNTSKNTSWNALILSFCLAAALGGAWLCLLYTALSRGEEPPLRPVPQGREATALPEAAQPLLAHPEPAQLLAEVAEVPPSQPAQNSPSDEKRKAHVTTGKVSNEVSNGKSAPASRPRSPTPAAPERRLNLSAYRVRAHRSEGEALLPEDTSLSVKDLNRQQTAGGGEKKGFDGGNSIIGDLYRGGRRLVDSMDAATLNATRHVLGDIARPDKAKLRPGGGGVRLNIEIPPESVRLGR